MRPVGDNDIYARQVYDVWSATHELRVGHKRRNGVKSAREVRTSVPGKSREIRVLRKTCARESTIFKVSHIFNATDLRADDTHIGGFMQHIYIYM